ncbi:Uncharacterised protein [Collinsella aerofaciens]|nr:Uncharacterised protein [Collinsella aerofaciens]
MLKSFKYSPTLEAMLSFAGWKVLSCALAMWLSGALDKTPCVGGAE